jgi:hypothetical protein
MGQRSFLSLTPRTSIPPANNGTRESRLPVLYFAGHIDGPSDRKMQGNFIQNFPGKKCVLWSKKYGTTNSKKITDFHLNKSSKDSLFSFLVFRNWLHLQGFV